MDLKDVQSLIRMVNKGRLAEFQWKNEDFEIFIKTEGSNVVQQVVANPAVNVPVSAVPVQSTGQAAAAPVESEKESAIESSDSTAGLIEIRSPIVGTFYRSASPEKPPFLKVGDKVSQGDVVCIVEAMKLFNEIESDVSGTVAKVMVEDASPVEYDQVLFLVEP